MKIDALLVLLPTSLMYCDVYERGYIRQDCQVVGPIPKPTKHVDYVGNVPCP